MTIAVVAACGANFSSVKFAIERLGKPVCLTNDATLIQNASHVILPGVGSASYAMSQLKKYHLVDVIRALRQPVLGICLGMQILFEFSQEDAVPCLGVMRGIVKPLRSLSHFYLPHMGWNQFNPIRSSFLLKGFSPDTYMYYVHRFCVPIGTETVATTTYTETFSAIVQKDQFFGVQFHPERSGASGALLLKNFLECA